MAKYSISSILGPGLVCSISSVRRASDLTVYTWVMGSSSSSWHRWCLGWKYPSKVGLNIRTPLKTKEVNTGTQRKQDCIAEWLVLCVNGRGCMLPVESRGISVKSVEHGIWAMNKHCYHIPLSYEWMSRIVHCVLYRVFVLQRSFGVPLYNSFTTVHQSLCTDVNPYSFSCTPTVFGVGFASKMC